MMKAAAIVSRCLKGDIKLLYISPGATGGRLNDQLFAKVARLPFRRGRGALHFIVGT